MNPHSTPSTASVTHQPSTRDDRRRSGVLSLATAAVLVIGVAGCGSGEEESSAEVVMPDVIGQQLDVALSDIERAGVEDDVEILGGGTFGVVDESNWQVCEQLPAAGEAVSDAPRLTVDRECPNTDSEAEAASPETTELPTTEPETTEPPTTEPTTTEPETTAPVATEVAPVENLTPENNAEFAALLAGELGDCGDAVAGFAATYEGRNIEFDGNVADWAPHGDYDTRFDFLIWGGDYSLEPLLYTGPSMKFEDVNRSDLNLIGNNVPDGVSEGDNFHIVAEIVEFRSAQCLLILNPVSMELR